MATVIQVDTQELLDAASKIAQITGSLDAAKRTLSAIHCGTPMSVVNARPSMRMGIVSVSCSNLQSTIASYSRAIGAYQGYTDRLCAQVRSAAERFDATEQSLIGELTAGAPPGTVPGAGNTPGGNGAGAQPGDGSDDDSIWDFELFAGAKNKKAGEAEYTYDFETKKWGTGDDDSGSSPKRETTILEAELSASGEVSYWEAEASGETEWGQGEVSANVGNAEAEASLSAGLYVYDKEGNKIFAPGVQAKIGAGVSLLELAAAGRLGNDDVNVFADGTVTVAEASAEATLTAGLFNKEGKLDVNAKFKAEAEANLVEIEGKAGISILGTEAAVTGGLKVGIGAHADVGYADGKLKVDIGASLGVGVEVGFELDVGGLVKNAAEGLGNIASGACEAIGGWFKW